jgi:formate dehydrogenase major subunit
LKIGIFSECYHPIENGVVASIDAMVARNKMGGTGRRVRVRALVTDRVRGHELYMPMNSTEHPVNRLTSSRTDPVTHTPAYKETSVRMEILSETGESPLPPGNSRFGHPTPQRGVEVERKWKRPDYRSPGSQLVQIQQK